MLPRLLLLFAARGLPVTSIFVTSLDLDDMEDDVVVVDDVVDVDTFIDAAL